MENLSAFFETLSIADVTNSAVRYLFPILALMVLIRCARSLLGFEKEPEVWAWLATPDGDRLPVTHWETVLGRSNQSDVVLPYPTISRTHAVLTRYDDGSWTISDVGSKGGILVNGEETSMCVLEFGDVISLGGVDFKLVPITKKQEVIQASVRTRAGGTVSSCLTLCILMLFQMSAAFQLSVTMPEHAVEILSAFGLLVGLQWGLFFAMRIMRRTGFEVETLAFFLCTIGLAVIASDNAGELKKQMFCIIGGLVIFLFLCWSLRNLERAKRIRYLAAALGLGLLAFNLVFGVEQYGAKNWIYLGGMSVQPSELVKLCFIFTGASTLQRIMTKRNMFLFIAYSAMICGCLVLMSDFGTALIFFVTFLVIAYMRSGNFATIALILSATVMGGGMVLRFKPYILDRFSAWGHVWEDPLNTGYQQTRSMMCIASGGLFGLGLGEGWLKYVAASDTDLVFAFVAEEWGLLMSFIIVAAILCMGVFVLKSVSVGRSSFYAIGAAAASAILVTQCILNVFGTLDLLPLTGVTFPFVSNGGSSMIACWGLLAFIKAADTRQNASMAVKLPSARGIDRNKPEEKEPV